MPFRDLEAFGAGHQVFLGQNDLIFMLILFSLIFELEYMLRTWSIFYHISYSDLGLYLNKSKCLGFTFDFTSAVTTPPQIESCSGKLPKSKKWKKKVTSKSKM